MKITHYKLNWLYLDLSIHQQNILIVYLFYTKSNKFSLYSPFVHFIGFKKKTKNVFKEIIRTN